MTLYRCFGFIVVALLSSARLGGAEIPFWLPQAHAHNDYLHPRPLLDALAQGFCSVEADIFLVDGKLLVAHDRDKLRPDRTLQALYLDPLQGRVRENGGQVYRGGPEFTLLIDFKEDWRAIYPVLLGTLTNYADMLTTFVAGIKRSNAVLVVISGSRDVAMFDRETVRYAAYDGSLRDLESNLAPEIAPWVSANWRSLFQWNGRGAIPSNELTTLRKVIERAHAQGRRVRFWGCPDVPNLWQVMHVSGVDLINTDDLKGLRDFLNQR